MIPIRYLAPLLVAVGLLLAANPARSESHSGARVEPSPPGARLTRCIGVLDGDTIVVPWPDSPQGRRVRLRGISAPEIGQPWSYHALALLRDTVLDKQVRLVKPGEDRYGRILAYVDFRDPACEDRPDSSADGCEWQDAAEPLVRAGYAGVPAFPDSRDRLVRLRELEAEARAARRGIWNVERQ